MMEPANSSKIVKIIRSFAVIATILTSSAFPSHAKSDEPPAEKFLCGTAKVGNERQAIFEKLRRWYENEAAPTKISVTQELSTINIFDCGYLIVVEFRPRKNVFGVAHAFLFSSKDFQLVGNVFIED